MQIECSWRWVALSHSMQKRHNWGHKGTVYTESKENSTPTAELWEQRNNDLYFDNARRTDADGYCIVCEEIIAVILRV